jgi:molybdate transport system ATP-binding protein
MLALDLELKRSRFRLSLKAQMGAGITGICGPSGAGKSTLLGVIAGLVTPERGRIVLGEKILLDTAQGINIPAHQRHIGLVFQDGQLFPHFSVKQNLLYGYQRQNAMARRFELDEVASLLEITPLLERRPLSLSGGEKQRVALGRALLSSPRLLLLDEPLAALDDRLKDQILPFLLRIRDETRIPMLYVSHSMREIATLTNAVVRLENGSMTES